MSDGNDLIPFNSYLIKAADAWIRDNNLTPMITVDALYPGVDVPIAYVKDGVITLNLSYVATSFFQAVNDGFRFAARFNGVSHDIVIPFNAIRVIYAKERSEFTGIALPAVEAAVASKNLEKADVKLAKVQDQTEPTNPTPRRRGHLTLVQ